MRVARQLRFGMAHEILSFRHRWTRQAPPENTTVPRGGSRSHLPQRRAFTPIFLGQVGRLASHGELPSRSGV